MKECPECRGIVDKTKNWSDKPVYKCRCCYREFSRRINKPTIKRIEKQNIINKLFTELLGNAL